MSDQVNWTYLLQSSEKTERLCHSSGRILLAHRHNKYDFGRAELTHMLIKTLNMLHSHFHSFDVVLLHSFDALNDVVDAELDLARNN